jgi:hypothetical protein
MVDFTKSIHFFTNFYHFFTNFLLDMLFLGRNFGEVLVGEIRLSESDFFKPIVDVVDVKYPLPVNFDSGQWIIELHISINRRTR